MNGPHVIDHRHDEGRLVQPLLERSPGLIPNMAKFASPAHDVYAWPEAFLFPVSTPHDAALSVLYMGHQIDRVPKEARERVVKAAMAHGIDVDLLVKELRTLTQRTKVAAAPTPPDQYALPELRRWRMADQAETRKAAEATVRFGRQLGYDKRASAALRTVQRARQLQMKVTDLPSGIYKAAGLTACDPGLLADQLTARANLAPSLEWRAVYSKLASAAHRDFAGNHQVYTRPLLTKMAGAIEGIDKACGLDRLWGSALSDPCDAVFNTDKLAADSIDCAGTAVSLNKLRDVPKETLEDILGAEFVAEVTDADGTVSMDRLAEVVPTLPLPMKKALATNLGPQIRA